MSEDANVIVEQVLHHLREAQIYARDYVDNIHPRYHDYFNREGANEEGEIGAQLYEVNNEFEAVANDEAGLNEAVESTLRNPEGDDTPPYAFVVAGRTNAHLSVAEAAANFYTRVVARARRLSNMGRQFFSEVVDVANMIRRRLGAALVLLAQHIMRMRTPTGWTITGTTGFNLFGVVGEGGLEINFGP